MGVTLERVQNKFACIIGELCNEPVILSQFAIWVDLRIAEFKTKGAISLDCSGEEPEPEWMNGHRLPKRRGDNSGLMNRHSRHEQKFQPMGGGPTGDRDTGFLNEGRLSPELLLIKEEALSSHEHMHHGRKRSHSQTVSQADNSFYHQDPASSPSTAKMKRYSSSGDGTQPASTETTSNQSLMSIISGGLDTQNQSSTDISASDIDVILDFENSSSSVPKSTDNQGSSSAMPEAGPSTSFDADNSFNRDNNMTAWRHVKPRTSAGNNWTSAPITNSPQTSHRNVGESRLIQGPVEIPGWTRTNQGVRERVPNVESKSKATVRNIANAVGVLERWLVANRRENRNVEDIPPRELGRYLCDFYQVIQKPSGEDYDTLSFTNLRSCIHRFLKEKNYSCSIIHAEEFRESREAYVRRQRNLQANYAEKMMHTEQHDRLQSQTDETKYSD